METTDDHGALMDKIYRGQRHIYDATRKYYLFGRDRLIGELDLPAGGSVLEIGCGTGRNLALIGQRWPGAELFGLDISAAMLENAARKLGPNATLSRGDACGFDPQALFGRERFDRVVLSFTLSMIPDWRAALTQAAALTTAGGSLHLVDFGDMAGLYWPAPQLLRRWLAHFHVSPRAGLIDSAAAIAAANGLSPSHRRGPGGYYTLITLRH